MRERLAELRGTQARRGPSARSPRRRRTAGPQRQASSGERLPVLGTAPDFTGNQEWFNTPGGRPLSLAELRGSVVLVDFWTYTCINCIRTLPYLKAWDERYREDGLTIVGVHTPEFPFERDAGNVEDAIEQNDLRLRGRPGQRLRDLERLRQRILARQVPDRRPGPGPLHPLRRGRIRGDRGRRSASCWPRPASGPARR